jgi:hypothetical protein
MNKTKFKPAKFPLLILAICLAALPLIALAGSPNVNLVDHQVKDNKPIPVKQMSATATARTPTISSASTSGSVTAGARKITFIFSSDFTGTVLGVAFTGANDTYVNIDAPGNDTLTAVAYTVTAGSVRILKVQ